MKGHNICAWLKVGEADICGKSCCQKYCKVQLAKIRKGNNIPVPCRFCGNDIQSEIELYQACGREKIRYWHLALEKIARHQFQLVLNELFAN